MKPKQTQLDKFEKDFNKLLSKYPNISVYGNMDGIPFACANDVYVKPPTITLKTRHDERPRY
jgi:hypothetical protein